ncbi:MAG TPA: hypothetical protein VGH73_23680 [Thermoanaerobaculia bacterium]|jgi:hypothetical protein
MAETEYFKRNDCGHQLTALELPDVVYMKLKGRVTLDECKLINQAHLEYAQDVSYFLYLLNLKELEDLPPEVRKEASATVKLLPVRGTVVCNAPLRAKVLARLLLTASNLFRRGPEVNPMAFVDSEEEARAWIEKRRQEIAAAA